MELFGYALTKHLEVFSWVFLFVFAFTTLARFLDSKKSLKHILVGAMFSLLNTVYLAIVVLIFRTGRDFHLLASMAVVILLVLLLIHPYMVLRGKLETLDKQL